MPPDAPRTSSHLWWHAVNYAARLLVVAMGLVLILAPLPLTPDSEVFVRTFGVVMALFGLYRLVWYYWRTRQQRNAEG